MAKAVTTTDVNVQSTQQLVNAIGLRLSKVATLANHPQAQILLDETWEFVQQLERINHSLDAIVAGAQAALKEMAKQRDEAVTRAKDRDAIKTRAENLRRAGEEWAIRILSGQIAYDGAIPVPDVLRVLDMLAGNRGTFDDPRIDTLYEAIEAAGNAILEQELLETAEAEVLAAEMVAEETED